MSKTNWADFTPIDDAGAPAPAPATDWSKFEPIKEASAARKLGDLGLSVAKGVVAVPEAAVGLADLVSGGHAGKFLENEGGAVGFRPKQAKEFLTSLQSDDLNSKRQQFQQADGVVDKFGVAVTNPSLIANTVAESVPLMGAGAVPARALLAAAPGVGAVGAGAIGEGLVGAGSAAEQIRQETKDGLLTGKQALLAGGSGLAVGAFGAAGGAAARRLGIADVDTALAQGTLNAGTAANKGLLRRTAEGVLSEGVLEELPQSLSEQALQNIALDKPVTEGLTDAGVMGVLAGGVMGGGAAALTRQQQAKGLPDPDAGQPPAQPPVPAAEQPPAPFVNPDSLTGNNAAAMLGGQGNGLTGSADPLRAVVTPSQVMGIDPNAGAISRVAAEAVDGPASMEMAVRQAERDMAALAAEDNPDAGADPLTAAPDPLISQVAGYVGEMGTASPQMVAAKFGVTIPRAAELLAQADPTVDDLFPPPQGAANVSNADAAGALAAGTGGPVGADADGGQPDAGLLGLDGGRAGAGTAGAPAPSVQESVAAPVPGQQLDPALTKEPINTKAKVGGLKELIARNKAAQANVQDQPQGTTPAAAPAPAPAVQAPPPVGSDGAAQPGAATAGRAGVEAAGLKSGAVGDEQPFKPETGTLGVPRADMPQVPTASHGGLVKHLNAQGIDHETTMVDAGQLKPTQAEYSPSKVEAAKTSEGDRAVIVSNDGHIIDGHHQALAAAQGGKPVKAIVLDAPVEQALQAVKDSPSAQTQPTKVVPQPTTEPTNGTQATQAVETAPQGREEAALLSDSVSTEPNLEAAKALLARQRAATGNAVAEGKVRKELRDLAAKTPETDTKTVLALDTAATRLGMGEGRLKGLEFKQDEAPAAPAVAAPAPAPAAAPASAEPILAKREDGTLKNKNEYTEDEWKTYTKSVIDAKLGDPAKPSAWSETENGFTKRPVHRYSPDPRIHWATVQNPSNGVYVAEYRIGDKVVSTEELGDNLTAVKFHVVAKVKELDAKQASHQDPGEKPEAATKGVVTDSLKTAAKNEDTKPSEMRKWLLAEIDKELLQAPDRADYDEAVKTMGEKDAISMYTGNGFLGKNTETGFITFDVPGDGKFKVRNSVRGLLEFRKTVNNSLGFKDSGQKTLKPEQNDGVQGGSGGQMTAITNMIEEGDFEAARDYAEAVGIKLEDVKVSRGERKPQWEKFLKDGTVPPPPNTEPLPEKKTADQLNAEKLEAEEAERRRPKDTGWNMAGTGYGGKRYTGRNITLDDGREVVARIYENAGNYEEAEVREGSKVLLRLADRYRAQERVDAWLDRLMEKTPALDLMGFKMEPMDDEGSFRLLDGNMVVSVERTDTGLQARHRSAKSSPRLTDQQAVEWAANIRDESKKEQAAPAAKPVIPEGFKPAGEPFYRDGNLVQGYAPFDLGQRVTMKESGGQSGVIDLFTSPDDGGVFSGAMVKFDNGVEQIVKLNKLEAEAAPAATGTRRDPTKVSMFNPYSDGDIVTINGQDWTVKADTPGWYLTTTGNWRGQHPTIRNVKAMADLIREVEQAAEAAPAPQADAPKLTQAEAKDLMEWQDLGQKDGIKTHILTFYESKADKDAKRGRMVVATVTKEADGKNWVVEGTDDRLAMLAMAKKKAEEAGMARAVADGFVEAAMPTQDGGRKVGALPKFPVDAYRLERYYANGAKVKPLPAKAFSPADVQAITDWFKSIGWSVTSGSGANGVNATNDIGMTVDDLPEPYTAAQRKKDEAQKDADERSVDKQKAQDDYLASTDAGRFVSAMFGEAMNRFNQTALAKVLSGDEKTFGGLFSNRAADALAEAGIATEGREVKDVIRDIKALFSQSLEAPKKGLAGARAKKATEAEELAAGPVVKAPAAAEQRLTGAEQDQGAKAAPTSRIGDFGEKIGGAKKDMWTGFKDDLTAVSDDDIASQPLSKVWPAPDYQALIDGGASPEVIAFVRSARDEVPAKPRVAYKVKAWANKVRTLRGMAVDLMAGKITMDDVRNQLERTGALSRSMQGFMGRVDLYQAVGHEKSLDGIRMAWHNYTIYKGQKDVSMWVVEKDAAATTFGNWPTELATGKTKEEAIEAFKKAYAKLDSDKEAKKGVQFDIISFRGQDGYWIAKKLGRNHVKVHGPLATVKEAREYRDQNQADLVAKLEKIKEIPDERRDVNEPRVGEDMRNGADVTPELFAQTFSFKGVEFGNWVEQGRRQQDLNNAFDALMDMAAVLGIPPRAISLNGQLGLAFGARGSGGSGMVAAAHYEPDKVVINLTKKNGAGSLGHEWWHAVDNYFAKMRKENGGAFMTTARDVLLASRDSGYMPYAGVRPEMVKAFGEVVKAINLTGMKKRASVLDGKRSKEYWTTGEEMSARSFESYLIAKLQDQNASNDYLANIVSEGAWNAAAALGLENENSYPYPVAKEVPGIRAAFDQFFQTVQTKEDDAGNVAMFSQGLLAPTSLGPKPTADQIQRLVDKMQQVAKNALPVTVTASPSDIPGLKVPAGAKPTGVLTGGRIYLFADNIRSTGEAYATLFHELFHLGLQKVIPAEDYAAMLAKFSRNLLVQRFVREWKASPEGVEKAATMPAAAYDALAAEEALAMVSEELAADGIGTRNMPGMVKAMLSWLSNVADRLGFPPSFSDWVRGLTRTDAEKFVSDMVRAAMGGEKNLGATRAKYGTELAEMSDQTRLSAGAAAQTDTPAFKRWFGNSAVVDADGKPLVVYHGTSADITVFDEAKSRYGFWFSADSADAEDYGGNTVEAYLSLKNPAYFERISGDKGVNDAIAKAKSDGHDGLIVTAPEDGDTNGMYWPTNYVAFRPEQIKSAIGNQGTFDPQNPDIRFRSTPRELAGMATDQLNTALKSVTITSIKQAAGYKATDLMGIALGGLGRRQLVEIYGKDLPLDKYNELATQMEADKNEYGAEADSIATEWGKLKDEGALANIMHDATLAKIDPDKPLQPGDDPAAYNALKMRFGLMSKEAKETYRKARDGYKRHHANVREAIKERIERSQMSPERRAALVERMDSEFFAAMKGVYFPLARFGKYVVVVRGADGKVETVARSETMAEAAALRRNLVAGFPASKGYQVDKVILSREFVASRDAVGRGFMQELYQVLDKQDMDPAMRAEMEDTLGQLYLSSLPDVSWAKHGIHRKGTPGFSQDARRAFAQNMFHGARYLAKLRYSDLMQNELKAMQDHVDKIGNVLPDEDGFNGPRMQRVVDEFYKRHDSLMNPNSHPLSTALTSIGFMFHLGLSPASALVNLTQTAFVAYPVMAAKWGFGKAGVALLKASKQAAMGRNDITKFLNRDERRAYDEAVRAGTIDVTMAHDLAGIAQGEDAGVMWRIRPAMRAASFLFHHAERFNRQATFVAAYRLSREAGAAHEAAFEQATKATYDGHFDYSSGNRPRFMQGNTAKVILLFKSYAQNMVYTLARNAYQSVNGLDPKERAEARKALSGILATHAMAAGVLGLPMVTTILAAISAAGSDDDEPFDAQVALQNMLADTFGQKPAEVITRGLSRLTPWDISGRVGLDRLIFPDVQEGLEGQRLAEAAAFSALGPVVGIFANFLKGVQEISEGHMLRGITTMMPAALRGPLNAVRLSNEGAQDKTGIPIVDEVDAASVFGQALGFSPSVVRQATEGKRAVLSYDRALNERRQELMTQYARGAMKQDAEAMQEAREAIQAFNEKNPGRRITMMQLSQSIRNRERRINQADDGVYLPKNRREAMEQGRFALTE